MPNELIPPPTDDQALQFAIMLAAGLPALDALGYFVEYEEPDLLAKTLRIWQKARSTRRAMMSLQKRPWAEMSLDERMEAALSQHYNGLAYMLYTLHYQDSDKETKAKLDEARKAIEARLAGNAGKGDALSRFFDDLSAGRIQLNTPAKTLASRVPAAGIN